MSAKDCEIFQLFEKLEYWMDKRKVDFNDISFLDFPVYKI